MGRVTVPLFSHVSHGFIITDFITIASVTRLQVLHCHHLVTPDQSLRFGSVNVRICVVDHSQRGYTILDCRRCCASKAYPFCCTNTPLTVFITTIIITIFTTIPSGSMRRGEMLVIDLLPKYVLCLLVG